MGAAVIDIARKLSARGRSVISIKQDKTPNGSWKEAQQHIIDPDKLNLNGCLGLVCGKVSGNIEAIDVDAKNDNTLVERFQLEIDKHCPELLEKLVIQRTPSGGLHLVYSCSAIEGNKKLASRFPTDEERKKSPTLKNVVLIETRGEGGYIAIAPTPGYNILHGTFEDIQEITPEEREQLFTAARSLNECFQEVRIPKGDGLTPWDDFNSRFDVESFLIRHDWKQSGNDSRRSYWRRPGKDTGHSATWNPELRMFYCFTSSSALEPSKAYAPAALFAFIECNGDFSEAAKRIYAMGFGDRGSRSAAELLNQSTIRKDDITAKTALTDFEKYRITDLTPIPKPVPVVSINEEIISTAGNITALSGPSKSGKSGFTAPIIAGAISEHGSINDQFEFVSVAANPSRHAVIHIDTEQSRWKHQLNLKGILKRLGADSCPPNFLSYNIRELPLSEYKQITIGICKAAKAQFDGVHLIVIDGAADYIEDVNDPQQANAIVKTFEEIAIEFNCPVIVIIHTNPSSDKERGHLGSQLQRKAESVLTVKSEGDISTLEPKFLRMAGKGKIPLVQFQFDTDKGYHVSIGTKSNQQVDRDQVKLETLSALAKQAFPALTSYKYKDAIDRVMKVSRKGDRTAKELFKQMRAHEMIKQVNELWSINTQA